MLKNSNAWYILGTGAIGTLWAAKLLQKMIPCVLLERSPAIVAQKELTKVTVKITRLDHTEQCLEANSQAINSANSIDKLIICTKSYQAIDAILPLLTRLTEDATIILLQNGMGQQQAIAKLLPTQTVIAASTTEGALLKAKLCVEHTGAGLSFYGNLNKNQQINQNISTVLNAIGMQHHADIQQVLWNKLTINCVINPLTAIYNCKNGELLHNTLYAEKVHKLCLEVDKIADALGFYQENLTTLQKVQQVAKATSHNYSSMQQDIKYLRKTEIEFINGYLQQQAAHLHIFLPENLSIIKQIQQLQVN
ncbi:MAG: 2-dehydropantoate 2-reductase [Oceanospirillaceae bacterium]|jgi:2-dehydropantoate 2-reductase